MQCVETTQKRIKTTIKWIRNDKRPIDRPKKLWMNKVKEDMEQLGITNQEESTKTESRRGVF